ALLGQQMPPTFQEAWYAAALNRLKSENPRDQFNQQELANIFYGHAKLGQPMPHSFQEAWYAAVLNRLKSKNPSDQFDHQALTNIFYGHVQLGQQMPPTFQKAWYTAALNLLNSKSPRDQFNQQALANIFYGHAQLGQKMPPTFQKAWYTAALNRLNSKSPRDQFNQQALANIFYGHVLLGQLMHPDFEMAWYAAALNRLKSPNPRDQFNQQELSNIFYGHALLQKEIPQDWINPLFNVLSTTESIKCMSSIYRGLSYFNLLEDLNSDPQRKRKYDAFCKRKNIPSKGSNLQTSVKGTLGELFPDEFQEEHWFDSLVAHVDFYSPQQNLVVEVDGPSHFIEKTYRYNAQTLLRDRILEKSDRVKVVHVPYFEWAPLRNDSEKKQYLMRKVRSLDSEFSSSFSQEPSSSS
ncbi:MAG: hypothetical protein K2X28_06005, partial [Alphaproteobacteria bacterium]|nr:hypothetical protein [Alphaproteobacteria bacterium]